MNKLKKDDLLQFQGKTLRVLTLNGGLLRNKNCAFYASINEEDAASFSEDIKAELPEGDYNFSTVGFEIEDISNFNLLFDNNYPGFQIVSFGYIDADQLYEQREDVVDKITNIFLDNKGLYLPYDKDDRIMGISVDKTHVTMSMFTDANKAAEVAENGIEERVLEQWINLQVNDTTIFSIDGEVVYGWEFVEGINRAWEQFLLDSDSVKELIEGNTLHVLATKDGSGVVMRYYDMPIFFLSDEALEEFAKANVEQMAQEFFDMEVSGRDGVELIVSNAPYVVIDGANRYVCTSEDLLKLYE
ncbi:MAG: hypothetical protein K5769_06060 [Pseudobutyrivibrio sp.]|nr:hypothetical protein [Pseudobutyrivibrio sp.]